VSQLDFSQPSATVAAALIALGGTMLGLLAGFATAELSRRQKADELFFKALDFLKGGTQNRNLGISAIELYGLRGRRHRSLSISLLTGSAIYLLLESRQVSKAHELYNLDRIMHILGERRRHGKSVRPAYQALLEAVGEKKGGHIGGVKVTERQLDSWRIALEQAAP
jgi:hypothetical protein